MTIIDYIPAGKANAVPRSELVRRMGLPDRTVRNMIEVARKEGAPIINAQDGAGYYLGESLEDFRRQYRRNQNRALSILQQQKHLRRRIRELEESGYEEQMLLDL